ncbi:hypothetical protein [Streptomyces malaysiensis]|nr:hypothetical protein R8789_08760 [Streptomyces malaysiensis]
MNAGKRGLITSIGQAGLSTGGVLSTVALAAASALPEAQFLRWAGGCRSS